MNGFKVFRLITPSTLLLLIPAVGAIAVYGYATLDKGQEERPPSPKRDGGASAVQPSSLRLLLSPAAPKLAPRPWDPLPGPDATATALGVNGSFYLNAEKFSVCRLVQNLTSLPTSCVQVVYKFRAPNLYRHC